MDVQVLDLTFTFTSVKMTGRLGTDLKSHALTSLQVYLSINVNVCSRSHVQGDYTDKGYVSRQNSSVPGT